MASGLVHHASYDNKVQTKWDYLYNNPHMGLKNSLL